MHCKHVLATLSNIFLRCQIILAKKYVFYQKVFLVFGFF